MLHKPFPTLIGKSRKDEENQIAHEKVNNIGTYMTQDWRKEVSKETKKTHFALGHDPGKFHNDSRSKIFGSRNLWWVWGEVRLVIAEAIASAKQMIELCI